ncbi:TPA: diaminopimelate decarboxylase [Morganella morganii]
MTIATKTLRAPFTPDALRSLAQQYGTPLWLYDSEVIISRIARLKRFDVIRFAQKANSNIHILRLMHEHGVKVDSVSAGEIERALKAGYRPDEIVFTADMITEETLDRVLELGIAVNTGSVDMLRQIGARRPGHPVWLRINPGFGHGHSQKTNTGGENSKHGIWFSDLGEALAEIRQYQLTLTGIHMHIGSGVDYEHLATVCDAMAELVITNNLDIRAISAGGGLSTPYREGDEIIDIDNYFLLWDAARTRIARHLGRDITLEIEPGRYLVAESGILLAQVRAVKGMGSRHYVLVDSGFNDLMRPAMYGSYHHISVLPAAGEPQNSTLRETIVAGPLCESGDVFTQLEGGMVVPRALPEVSVNDFLVFHDTGAYGASMSSNYNSRPLLPEVLFTDGKSKLIRRRQTIDELMALEITE